MLDYSHCLRPSFTQKVYRRLVEQGQAVNITGEKGSGRGRVLKDLEKILLDEGRDVLLIDFNRNQKYYELLEQIQLQMLAKKLMTDEEMPHLPPRADHHVFPVLNLFTPYFRLDNTKSLFLLFDNFDRILDNPNQRFPKAFFDDLNYIKNKPRIFIACATTKAIGAYHIHYINEQEREEDELSWLDFPAPQDVGPLKPTEIKAELDRCLADNERWQGQEDYVQAIHAHPACAKFLEYVAHNFDLYDDLPIPQHLEKLLERFEFNYATNK